MISNSKTRHILKAITWRLIASATTFLLALFFFKDHPDAMKNATGVALAESVLKMALYYFHERAWYKSKFGIKEEE